MAMLTPAQNPRGLARMIFTCDSPPWDRLYILTVLGDICQPRLESVCKRHRHSRAGSRVAMNTNSSNSGSLGELQLSHRDDLLLALFLDRSLDRAFHRRLADLAVILLVRVGVEDVDDVLVLFLDLDGR